MNIIQGKLPEEKDWRVMVLLSQDSEPGIAWQLGKALARAHHGDVIGVVMVREINNSVVNNANQRLKSAPVSAAESDRIYKVVAAAGDYHASVREFILEADIDLVILIADSSDWQTIGKLPCTIVAVRGQAYLNAGDEPEETANLKRILVASAGGPNSAGIASYLSRLTPEIEVTMLYSAPDSQGENGLVFGRSRLKQILSYIDADEKIGTKVVQSATPTDGICDEAKEGYDLVVLGATRQSSIDRAIFGDVVREVIRRSHTPVAVVREADDRTAEIFRQVAFRLQDYLPRMNVSERANAYMRIRRNARPDIDFYLLITLSAIIAAFGLLLNSPAVVIGAMLVAPLMSPIVGVGLAIVMGDVRFVRLSASAVLRGAALALIVGIIVGFLPVATLTDEVLARTQPSLLDLFVALFSGMAGAYALCKSEAAGALPGVAIAAALVPPLASSGIALSAGAYQQSFGALLLFTTNFIAISSAAAFVFIILGFRPSSTQKERKAMQTRSFRIAIGSLIFIAALLTFATIRLAAESNERTTIIETVERNVNNIPNAEFDDMDVVSFENGVLELDITARSTIDIRSSQVRNLRDQIGIDLQQAGIDLESIALDLSVILITKLDPEIPPTATPTTTATLTATAGPSATPANTVTATATASATATAITTSATSVPTATATATAPPTAAPTETSTPRPTDTVMPSPTTVVALVNYPFGLNVRAGPSAEADLVGFIEADTEVVLTGEAELGEDGRLWQPIFVPSAGITGWVVAEFLTTQ